MTPSAEVLALYPRDSGHPTACGFAIPSVQTVDYLVFVMEYCGGGEFYQSASNGPRLHGCTCATFAATAHSIRQNASALRFWLTLLGVLMNEPAQRQMAESDVRFYIAEARCLAHRCLAGRSGLCGCTCCCLLAAIRIIACRARHRTSHGACCYVGLLCARHHCSQSVHEGPRECVRGPQCRRTAMRPTANSTCAVTHSGEGFHTPHLGPYCEY